jgi:hypothetical protein
MISPENEGAAVLTNLVHALTPAIDDALRVVNARALAIVSLTPFVVNIICKGPRGEAVRVIVDREGDAELGTAAAAFVEFALRHHERGADLTRLAAGGRLRFVILFDEGEHRACLRAEMPEGSAKVGELRGEVVYH